jgi:hypothetical protein
MANPTPLPVDPLPYAPRHWLVQYGAMAAYHLPAAIVIYAARIYGLSTVLDLLLGSLVFESWQFMRAYRLSGNTLRKWRRLPWAACIAWLHFLYSWRSWFELFLDIFPRYAMVSPKFGIVRTLEGYGFPHAIKALSDYMKKLEARSTSPFFDGDVNNYDIRHNGCKLISLYDECITTSNHLLRSDCLVGADDVCLSYSFSQILLRAIKILLTGHDESIIGGTEDIYSLVQSNHAVSSLTYCSLFFIKHHPVEEDDVRVPDSVRRFVALITLKDMNDGRLTNGTRSLQRNRDKAQLQDDLTCTCRQQTHTHTILIWHIATCYCDMSPPNSYCYWPGNLMLKEISTYSVMKSPRHYQDIVPTWWRLSQSSSRSPALKQRPLSKTSRRKHKVF